ncbi:hypothetical protein EJB05_49026, partial [Eragrostis curvula]
MKMPSLGEMARLDADRTAPAWLHILLETIFFDECLEHLDASRVTRRVSCNLFCVDGTSRPLCSDCIEGEHDSHRIIQTRKSSRHNVAKVKDVESQLGIREVQTYPQHNDLVVFLNKRPMEGNGKPGEYRCKHCDRALLKKEYRFCSLGCKAIDLFESLRRLQLMQLAVDIPKSTEIEDVVRAMPKHKSYIIRTSNKIMVRDINK